MSSAAKDSRPWRPVVSRTRRAPSCASATAAAARSSTQSQQSPSVACQPRPELRERDPGGARRARRGGRDASREGVRGVDDRGDSLVLQPEGERLGPAEAADAHLADGQPGPGDATGERGDDRHGRVVELLRERTGLGGPAENQHAPAHRRRSR